RGGRERRGAGAPGAGIVVCLFRKGPKRAMYPIEHNGSSTIARLPRSGNAALAAGAVIQAALGVEFLLAGLSKYADAEFTTQFKGFVEGSPGAKSGILAPVIQTLVVPNVTLAADLAKFTEVGAGVFLLLA